MPKSTRSKEKPCNICGKAVRLSKANTCLQCPHCAVFVHVGCAKESREIASNGFYYCDEHFQLAPKSLKRNQPSQSVRFSEFVDILPSTYASQINATFEPQFSMSENAVLNVTNPIARPIPNLLPLTAPIRGRTSSDLAANSPQYERSSVDAHRRKANAPNTTYPLSNQLCKACGSGYIFGKYFHCVKCKSYYHNDCVNGIDRMGEIGEYWACFNCVAEKYKKGAEDLFARGNSDFFQELENLRLDNSDTHATHSRDHSNQEYRSNRDQHPNQNHFSNRNETHIQQPPPQPQNLQNSDNATMMQKLMDTLNSIQQQLANNHPVPSKIPSNIPPAQSTPTSQNQRGNQMPKNTQESYPQRTQNLHPRPPPNITPDIEDYINNSIRNYQCRNEFNSLNESNRLLAQVQLHESRKNAAKILPKVKTVGYEWKIFYSTFLNTKSLFTPVENVIRVSEAIECSEIKSLGGINLLTPDTLEDALMEINKRVGKPKYLLTTEKLKLVDSLKLRNVDVREIIIFIENVKKYNSLVEKIGNCSDKADSALMARIFQILPEKLQSSWLPKYSQIERDEGCVCLSDMSTWLDRQVENYENALALEKINPYGEVKKREQRQFVSKDDKKKARNVDLLFHQRENSTLLHDDDDQTECVDNVFFTQEKQKNNNTNFCWHHESNNHSSLNCSALLKKTGKEAGELARLKHICTICNQPKHNAPCPMKNKHAECTIPGCRKRHCSLFCFKRNDSDKEKTQNKSVDSKKPGNSQKGKEDKRKNESQEKVNVQQQHTSRELDNSQSQVPVPTPANAQFYDLLNGTNHINISPNSSIVHTVKEIDYAEYNASKSNCHVSMLKLPNEASTSSSLLSVVAINLMNRGKTIRGAFLLDSGSTISMIDTTAAKILEAEGPKKPLAIAWSGGQTRGDSESQIIKLESQGLHKRARKHEILFRTMENLNMPSQHFDEREIKLKYTYLKKLELVSYSNIIGIIGTDQTWAFRQFSWIDNKSNPNNAPVAILTPLGYAVMGSLCPLEKMYDHLTANEKLISMVHVNNKIHMSEKEEEELIKMQEEIMGIEYLMPYENDRKIADEERAIEILKKSVSKVANSTQYQAPLLWRDDNVLLPTQASFNLSEQRLHILIKHATRIGKLDDLRNEIENLLEKDYARELSLDEVKNPPPNAFYIPIFISNPKGKRARLIWDAAAKINGKSLNDFMLTGPNLYADQLGLLMKMREGEFLVKADISEMFHQVKIIEKDCPALRFMFKDDIDSKIKYYESKVMIFGSVASPCTSQFVKNMIANEHKEINPNAAMAIKENTYVDDLVVSFNSLDYGQALIRDARKILKQGGFNLVKLKGNHPAILDAAKQEFTKEDYANPKLISNEREEKILGYKIDFVNDSISVNLTFDKIPLQIMNGSKTPTKQQLLRVLMSIYDPLGFLSFFTSKLKLLYHWSCKAKLGWKDFITEQQKPYWEKCLKWLKDLENIKIPRCYFNSTSENVKKQLIIFGDAGKEMLCSVAFIRTVDDQNRQLSYSFVMSKTYTVPLKQKRTIPELELDVACKNVELMKKIIKGQSIQFDETYFVTDNACVYHWIHNGPSKPSLYVRNRYLKIMSGSRREMWIWLPSDKMVADFGTKFESVPEFTCENKWFHPEIFSSPGENWLNSKPPVEQVEAQVNVHKELKLTTEKNSHKEGIFNLHRFSDWKKFLRTSINIVKYFQHVLNRIEHQPKFDALKGKLGKLVQNDEIYSAELLIIKDAQQQCYQQEIEFLKRGKTLPSRLKLKRFLPFIDSKGIIRIKTRLPYDDSMPYDKICPIVLPKHHRITTLIILHYHQNNHHQHYKTIVSTLLQRYFIENINWTVKKIIRTHCFKCKKRNAKPDTPQMGDLPSYRLATFTPPFSYTIMDVCGPFLVRINRRTEKRWLQAFSCLTTRALHLEVIHSMSAQSCLMALQNMINLRGAPIRIISDNGTNFVGANNILQEMHSEWNRTLVEKNVITRAIEWEFNPAKSSHMSGSIERMIGLVKSTLRDFHNILEKKILVPSEEVFRCMTCETIGLLNNRPLTMLPLENSTNDYLTPNHFLMLRNNFQATSPERDKYLSGEIKQWVEIKELLNNLWDHFHKSYLNEIVHRDKWIDFKTPLKVGDLVILADPSIANLWRMGVVIEISEGSNEQVRKLKIRLGKRNLPTVKSLTCPKEILKEYKKETFTIVTRPACAVAPMNLSAF